MENNDTETVEEVTVQEPENNRETSEVSEEEKKSGKYPTQAVLTIRTIVGVYVLYLAYQVITSGNKLSIPMWAAVILFIVAGSVLVVMSIKHFICGEYEGGKKDV